MGDSSLMTILSVVPLLTIVMAMAAAAVAWRFGRRAVRTAVAILLIVVGVASLLSPIGMLFSLAGGALIALPGVVLLVAEYRPKSAS
jgi:hypothetical protein